MISAIGVSYLLQNLALYITGGLNKKLPDHALDLRHGEHFRRDDQVGHAGDAGADAHTRRAAGAAHKPRR